MLIDRLLEIDYIEVAIPFFLVLIVIESALDIWKKRDGYQLGDTLANLSTGSITSIAGNLTKGLTFSVYAIVLKHCALLNMTNLSTSTKWLAAFTLLLGTDCLYYWFHRFAHRSNVGWIGHAVHHQSEEYNLSVALRQGIIQPQISWIFYLPLAVIGYPVSWLISVHAFVIAYQFWIHTEAIKTLGPLEWIFNTPSHHRVHHGVNKEYLDMNYAGVLVIWDKLFGTFTPEKQHPVYGTTTQLKSWSPLKANTQHIEAILEISKDYSVWNKILIWFMPPEWRPKTAEPCHFPTEAELGQRTKFKTPVFSAQAIFAGLSFAFGVAVTLVALNLSKSGPTFLAAFLGVVAFFSYFGASLIIGAKE